MFNHQSKDSYNEARSLILNSESVKQLFDNVKKVDKMIKDDKLDHYQAQKLEGMGFDMYYKIVEESKHLIKNQRITLRQFAEAGVR